jgi:hypothetical protein
LLVALRGIEGIGVIMVIEDQSDPVVGRYVPQFIMEDLE